jgi:hypothetical protein
VDANVIASLSGLFEETLALCPEFLASVVPQCTNGRRQSIVKTSALVYVPYIDSSVGFV